MNSLIVCIVGWILCKLKLFKFNPRITCKMLSFFSDKSIRSVESISYSKYMISFTSVEIARTKQKI